MLLHVILFLWKRSWRNSEPSQTLHKKPLHCPLRKGEVLYYLKKVSKYVLPKANSAT